jgi:hypothetical protein
MVPQRRVAIDARVSTLNQGQDPTTPLLALWGYAARRGCVLRGRVCRSCQWHTGRSFPVQGIAGGGSETPDRRHDDALGRDDLHRDPFPGPIRVCAHQ